MVDTAELYDFCLAWQMGYDTLDTIKSWFFELGMSYEEFAQEAKKLRWYVTSMNQIKEWENEYY